MFIPLEIIFHFLKRDDAARDIARVSPPVPAHHPD
jgi:hypothetical protein